MSEIKQIARTFVDEYKKTPAKVKVSGAGRRCSGAASAGVVARSARRGPQRKPSTLAARKSCCKTKHLSTSSPGTRCVHRVCSRHRGRAGGWRAMAAGQGDAAAQTRSVLCECCIRWCRSGVAVAGCICFMSSTAAWSLPPHVTHHPPPASFPPARTQFLYMMLVGTFPFNSFLAGILCSLSFFSLTGEFWTRQVPLLLQPRSC